MLPGGFTVLRLRGWIRAESDAPIKAGRTGSTPPPTRSEGDSLSVCGEQHQFERDLLHRHHAPIPSLGLVSPEVDGQRTKSILQGGNSAPGYNHEKPPRHVEGVREDGRGGSGV